MIGAYCSLNWIALTEYESVFKALYGKQIMAVEWGFGKVMQLFQFTNPEIMVKYGLSPIAPCYLFQFYLPTGHTCYFISKATMSFQCAPPNVRQYFGLTSTEREGLDLYIELVFCSLLARLLKYSQPSMPRIALRISFP